MAGSVVWRCRIHGNSKERTCSCPKAKWGIVFYVAGKPRWKMISPVKREAELALEETNHQLRAGTYHLLQPIRFKDLADKFLNTRVKASVKTSTYDNYDSKLRAHLIPRFGDMWVADISREMVERYRAELIAKGKHTDVSVAGIMAVLRIVLNVAVEWRYLRESPAARLPRMAKTLKEVQILEPHELNLLLRNAGEPWRTMWYTAAMTGMRLGELIALKKTDIDWDNNTITIQRSLGRKKIGGDYQWITPKSAAGVRTIEIWIDHKKLLQEFTLTSRDNPYGLLFATPSGLPINASNMTKRVWAEVLKQSQIQHVKFHALRHTHASMLIAAGADIKYIQHRMGHSSSKVTLDTYGHLMKGSGKHVGAKVESLIRLDPSSENAQFRAKAVLRLTPQQAQNSPDDPQMRDAISSGDTMMEVNKTDSAGYAYE